MSLTLGRQGGIAQPLKKRTVGQTNIAHVYDGANHIWPTSVIHFSDFTSVQLRYIWGSDDGRDLDTKSYYVNSPINSLNYIAVGWSWDSSQIPYLYWGGDNTDSGAECVMFNIESMIDLEDKMPDIMKMNLCANWFGSLSRGHVTVECTAYKGKLIQCEMEKMFTAGINYTDRKTCNVIYGVVTLPNEPTVTGLVGRNAYGCLPCGFTQPASGTPAQ